MAAGAWPPGRPLPLRRGDPLRRDPRLRAAGADLFLDLRLAPRPAGAEPGPARGRGLPALQRAGRGAGDAAPAGPRAALTWAPGGGFRRPEGRHRGLAAGATP